MKGKRWGWRLQERSLKVSQERSYFKDATFWGVPDTRKLKSCPGHVAIHSFTFPKPWFSIDICTIYLSAYVQRWEAFHPRSVLFLGFVTPLVTVAKNWALNSAWHWQYCTIMGTQHSPFWPQCLGMILHIQKWFLDTHYFLLKSNGHIAWDIQHMQMHLKHQCPCVQTG